MGKLGILQLAGEPEPETVADTTPSAPILVTTEGRGGVGKTRLGALLYERALVAKRNPILLDLDAATPAMSAIFPSPEDTDDPAEKERRIAAGGARRADSGELEDLQTRLEWGLNLMDVERRSVVLETGGGQEMLTQTSRALDLSVFCESIKAKRLRLMVMGPDIQDLQHIITLRDNTPFHSQETVLVLNEGKVPGNRMVAGAFGPVVMHPEFKRFREMGSDGKPFDVPVKVVRIPRLGCMEAIVNSRLTYGAVQAGKLGAFARTMTDVWRQAVFTAFEKEGVVLP